VISDSFNPDNPNRLPRDGVVQYDPNFLEEMEAELAFSELLARTPWREEEILMFGKKVMQPRLFSWHADPGVEYKYSGLRLRPEPWTDLLQELRVRIAQATGGDYNSVLLNLYRNERDSNGWHSDDEKELGSEPKIASLSLGEGRDFCLRHKTEKLETVKINLTSGSLLLMEGSTQENWKHCIPKRTRKQGPRINLTFRKIQL
jgi:alkylated DNA repair dioxygenase AlkB